MPETYLQFKKRLDATNTQPLVWGVGHPASRVVVLGFGPREQEQYPFTDEAGIYLRHTIGTLGIPPQMPFYSYIVKTHDEEISGPALYQWVTTTRREISTHLKPKAVILAGLMTYNLFFCLKETDIENVRETRICDQSLPDINFFVTHDPAHVLLDQESKPDILREFCLDLTAVFEVVPSHFKKLQYARRK
jgi:uracil-DNA glycosylase family 4